MPVDPGGGSGTTREQRLQAALNEAYPGVDWSPLWEVPQALSKFVWNLEDDLVSTLLRGLGRAGSAVVAFFADDLTGGHSDVIAAQQDFLKVVWPHLTDAERQKWVAAGVADSANPNIDVAFGEDRPVQGPPPPPPEPAPQPGLLDRIMADIEQDREQGTLYTPEPDRTQFVGGGDSSSDGGGVPREDRGGGGGGVVGAGDGAAPVGDDEIDSPTTPAGVPLRNVPGGGELWRIQGKAYLVYNVPNTDVPMAWRIDDAEALEAVTGTRAPDWDRDISRNAARKAGLLYFGHHDELANTAEHPLRTFVATLDKEAQIRPWLRDPEILALHAMAILESREVTDAELKTTDWWNTHTAAERAWMETAGGAGTDEVKRLRADQRRGVRNALAKSGIDNAPGPLVNYIADQTLTGKWSDSYATEQLTLLSDPFAPGNLDAGLLTVLREPGGSGDRRAFQQGHRATRARVKAIFDHRGVDIATPTETADERLDRITSEIMAMQREPGGTVEEQFDDVRRWVDLTALDVGGRVGGLDQTREGEDKVRTMLANYLGPQVAAGYSDQWIREQAGLIRNDPDAEIALTDTLRAAFAAAFRPWAESNENLRYVDIAPVARSLFSRVWGRSPDETSGLFMDVLNMTDQTEAENRLRHEGLKRGVRKVGEDALDLDDTPLGQAVQRSPI